MEIAETPDSSWSQMSGVLIASMFYLIPYLALQGFVYKFLELYDFLQFE